MMTPQTRNPAGGPGFVKTQTNVLRFNSNPADLLLQRLDKVRKTGKGWTARCPAHEDKTASLSIAQGDDGRVLLHCFAGCSAIDVIGAIGLSVADLFPFRERRDLSPMERAQRREYAQAAQVRAALNALTLEICIVEIACKELHGGRRLPDSDYRRFMFAIERIRDAREVLQ